MARRHGRPDLLSMIEDYLAFARLLLNKESRRGQGL
jgi:hypothetical protein